MKTKKNNLVKILLVDDLPENLFTLELTLADKNYVFVRAYSGNEALKILLRKQDFAIILMDVQMPEMDGFETIELIREIETLKHIPIILLTASMDRSTYISKGYKAGAVDYMIKPIIPEILKAKVAIFVELYKKNIELLVQREEMIMLYGDVTAQKRISAELLEAKSKAETATRFAEDAMKAKQQFLSNMSHEIRTPMNAIIGFTGVLLKTDLSEKQKEYLQAIKVSGDNLIVLINDILDLAKVNAGKMTFEQTPFQMEASLSVLLYLFETKILEKNLELVVEYDNKIPKVLLGDPIRLHQIILNLLSNAVKFTSKGKITVRVQILIEDDEQVTIKFEVTDTGIGIAQNKIEEIFENFQQASNSTSKLFGGTGLGLAIVKQLVELQNGEVNVKSKIDEGSTFCFTLSFLKTKTETDQDIFLEEKRFAETEIKNIKILVVEDMALNQLLMKTILEDFKFECDIAANGKIAIQKLAQIDDSGVKKSYDIILMDLQMPEMNGFEATEYIRKKMKSDIPIIALTADVTTIDLEKCKSIGMNDYISKPIDEKILYRKIVGLLKKSVLKNTFRRSNE